MRRLAVAIAAAGALSLLAAAPAAATFKSVAGLSIVSQRQLDSRLSELTIGTPVIDGQLKLRILVPADYAAHPKRRYPVLYLFDGTSGFASDWTTQGQAEQTTAGKELIVVMPDISINGDGGGWCADWWNNGARGKPKWETFHINQLIPFVDANLRTVAARRGRAVAGLSQGGFCSTSYPARHPDLFQAALSFSGAPDIAYDSEAQLAVTPVINATEFGLDHVPPNSIFGPRTGEELNWAAHDPTTLAENLRGMNIFLFTGNGQPGPLDPPGFNPAAEAIEGGVHELTFLFHNRLNALGIPSFYDDYGPGTHSWPYWARDLKQSIDPLMADFAHPPPAPRKVTFTSADPTYTMFGWNVAMHRGVWEFSTLRNASRGGFQLLGSGSATVTTPPLFKHGKRRRYRITISSQSGTTTRTVRVRKRHGLVLQVPLGPSNTVQEYSLDGSTLGTTVYTSTVTITRLRK